ncbi:hypothetical protein AVEN_148127-1 [Araneus ventricosus]|uniref:Uncharacterized protein n=1 Tax=Araneus ventricosus TaxID=182803 RepID=A0A4Y2SQG5_ARAVE|nr:hypothetical protein AVEN_148127-1 [Araneus ventricosus]
MDLNCFLTYIANHFCGGQDPPSHFRACSNDQVKRKTCLFFPQLLKEVGKTLALKSAQLINRNCCSPHPSPFFVLLDVIDWWILRHVIPPSNVLTAMILMSF